MPITLTDAKELVIWMRSQGVASFKMGELEAAFAPEAFLQAIVGKDAAPPEAEVSDEQRKKEEDDLLYHSAG